MWAGCGQKAWAPTLSADGDEMVTLNSTAADMWEMCDGCLNAEEISMKIADKYSHDIDEVFKDVLALLSKLENLNLLYRLDDQS